MRMPEMDGITVVRNLRKEGYSNPIVALTASGMKENLHNFLRAGCDEYAVKPIRQEKLFELTQKWLNPKNNELNNSESITRSEEEISNFIHEETNLFSSASLSESHISTLPDDKSLIFSSYHDDPEMEAIILEYVHTLPDKLESIVSKLRLEDWQSLARIVHGLHGSGGGFGFQILSDLGGKMERLINENSNKDVLENLLNELSKAVEQILQAYKSSRQKLIS